MSCSPTGVDVQNCSGDVARVGASQESDGRGDVFRVMCSLLAMLDDRDMDDPFPFD
jgi:hypothetical protein